MRGIRAVQVRPTRNIIHTNKARSEVKGHSRKDHKAPDYKMKQEFWRTLDLVQRGLMSKKERAAHMESMFNVVI